MTHEKEHEEKELHHTAHHHADPGNRAVGAWGTAAMAIIALALLVTAFNAVQLGGLNQQAQKQGAIILAAQSFGPAGGTGAGSTVASAALLAPEDVLPSGAPRLYGAELGVSYDDVSANNPEKANQTISVLGKLDDSITVDKEAKERYIRITNSISCEYCCGAAAITVSNGEPACGCAHSYAMRGLAKYLLTKHPDEFTDEEILAELGKWKTLFFPGIMVNKANVLAEKGLPTDYISLASNQYRGIEKQAQAGGNSAMVGGC